MNDAWWTIYREDYIPKRAVGRVKAADETTALEIARKRCWMSDTVNITVTPDALSAMRAAVEKIGK